jgi:hypothetical protein
LCERREKMLAEERKEKMTHTEAATTAAVTVDEDEEVKIRYDSSKQGWLSYVVAIVTLGALVGWFYTIAAIVLVCVYNALVHQSLVAVALLVVLFSSTYWPSQILWQDFIDSPIWKVHPQFNLVPSNHFILIFNF